MIIEKRRGKEIYFPEIKDLPYAYTLSPKARAELEAHLKDKIEKFRKRRQYVAMCAAKGEKPWEW